jgi:hypothetical protein
LLIGCAETPKAVVPVNLPPVPSHLDLCIRRHVTTLPRGDWTPEVIGKIIEIYQKRENELESCAIQLRAFYNDLRNGLRRG